MTGVPLVIDLDGTLLRSDLLQESTLKLLAGAPQHLFSLPRWLYTGKAHLKRQVAQRVRPIDIPLLEGDASQLRALTGWVPAISFRQSVEEVLDDWRHRT